MSKLDRFDEAARTIVGFVLVMVVALSLGLWGFSFGQQYVRSHAVCSAASEDSFPTDCDYHDHGWYVKK